MIKREVEFKKVNGIKSKIQLVETGNRACIQEVNALGDVVKYKWFNSKTAADAKFTQAIGERVLTGNYQIHKVTNN